MVSTRFAGAAKHQQFGGFGVYGVSTVFLIAVALLQLYVAMAEEGGDSGKESGWLEKLKNDSAELLKNFEKGPFLYIAIGEGVIAAVLLLVIGYLVVGLFR